MTKRAKLRKKLDLLWSVKVKEGGRCEKCGKTTYLNAHHFYSRSSLSTRWDLNNGFCLCSLHHTLGSKFSAHKTPADFVDWAIELRGDDWINNLRDKHNTIVKYSIKDLEEMLYELHKSE